jgi:predicted transcriptional regulator
MSHCVQTSTTETMDTHKEILHLFLLFMLANQFFTPYDSFEEACHQLNVDVTLLLALYATHYFNG